MVGDYFVELGNEKHYIEYKLSLNFDGTFQFHSFTNNKSSIPPVVQLFGKGTWKVDGKVVSFFTDKNLHLDENYILDFSRTKARFITKSARDKSDRIIKTRLKFFESKINWIKGLDIFKI